MLRLDPLGLFLIQPLKHLWFRLGSAGGLIWLFWRITFGRCVGVIVEYFRDNIIGGNGAFVEVAAECADFERAMLRKLVRETQNLMS
ncbi:MAG: DUF1194 domain-containing protein [Amylibacter sp.]|nr:DUF1194 domain-containing protein [Amylibacter sp.]